MKERKGEEPTNFNDEPITPSASTEPLDDPKDPTSPEDPMSPNSATDDSTDATHLPAQPVSDTSSIKSSKELVEPNEKGGMEDLQGLLIVSQHHYQYCHTSAVTSKQGLCKLENQFLKAAKNDQKLPFLV